MHAACHDRNRGCKICGVIQGVAVDAGHAASFVTSMLHLKAGSKEPQNVPIAAKSGNPGFFDLPVSTHQVAVVIVQSTCCLWSAPMPPLEDCLTGQSSLIRSIA